MLKIFSPTLFRLGCCAGKFPCGIIIISCQICASEARGAPIVIMTLINTKLIMLIDIGASAEKCAVLRVVIEILLKIKTKSKFSNQLAQLESHIRYGKNLTASYDSTQIFMRVSNLSHPP